MIQWRPRSWRRRFARPQLGRSLVGQPQRRSVEGDICSKLGAASAVAAPAERLELRFRGGESLLGLRPRLVEALLALGEQARRRVARTARLVERERLGRGERERAADPLCGVGPVWLVSVQFGLVGCGDEVEAGFRSRAGAGDVAPFPEVALVLEEDEGALDGRALGRVAGERVGVIEVVGGVVEGNRAERPGGRLQGERRGVELDDRSARAVSDRRTSRRCGGRRRGRRRGTLALRASAHRGRVGRR